MRGNIRVRLWGGLGVYAGGRCEVELEFEEPLPVRDVVEAVGVPVHNIALIAVNDKIVDVSASVSAGDLVHLYPRIGAG